MVELSLIAKEHLPMSAEPASGTPAATSFPLAVQQGRRYLLCVCGRSRKKPLCDGSHAGSGHLPDFYMAGESTTIKAVLARLRTRRIP